MEDGPLRWGSRRRELAEELEVVNDRNAGDIAQKCEKKSAIPREAECYSDCREMHR
jgi:hypothetical protein